MHPLVETLASCFSIMKLYTENLVLHSTDATERYVTSSFPGCDSRDTIQQDWIHTALNQSTVRLRHRTYRLPRAILNYVTEWSGILYSRFQFHSNIAYIRDFIVGVVRSQAVIN